MLYSYTAGVTQGVCAVEGSTAGYEADLYTANSTAGAWICLLIGRPDGTYGT